MVKKYSAVEFFSGMGSFAEACRELPIEVVTCFDQSQLANKVYAHNFGREPDHGNLDSITTERIPDADIWWMSPPCTPFSVRGRRADAEDPRARSFLNLVSLISSKRPRFVFVENVAGFRQSEVKKRLTSALVEQDYVVQSIDLCSTDFGVPMRRPRHFVVAARRGNGADGVVDGGAEFNSASLSTTFAAREMTRQVITDYITQHFSGDSLISQVDAEKFRRSTHVIEFDDSQAVAICFTKNYYSCRLASGSLIALPDGRLRRFSAMEMLSLFGFSGEYSFPTGVNEEQATGLIGNAVDVRMIRFLLRSMLGSA